MQEGIKNNKPALVCVVTCFLSSALNVSVTDELRVAGAASQER